MIFKDPLFNNWLLFSIYSFQFSICSNTFTEKIESYLSRIKINGSPNSRIRAFKSLHWAPRWNLVNLEYFRYVHPVEMPYYNDSLCKFICSVPEEYLSSRKIQIEYIKRFSPALAKQTWQDHRPFNLYNYHYDNEKNRIRYCLLYLFFCLC